MAVNVFSVGEYSQCILLAERCFLKRAGLSLPCATVIVCVARSLANKKVPYEYESVKLTYVPKPRTYTPDFYLPEQKMFIEVKGYFDKGDRVKMQLIKEQYPDHDIRIVFLNAKNKIYKGSKTTYGAWADRHGFKWAEGSIPEEWYKDD